MLTEKNTVLKRLNSSHARDLSQLADNKEIWLNVRDRFPHPYTASDAVDYIKLISEEAPPSTFGIFFKGNLAGTIGLTPFTDVNRIKAEVGFWIGELFWGNGIATSALKLICDYAFKELGLVRLEALVFDYNEASTRVLEKNGFTLDARLEKSAIKNGVICDQFLFSKVYSAN